MLFWRLILVSVRSQMQYPASFFMLALSHFLGTFIDILGIWILFDRFKLIKGWTLFEVGLLYGVVQMGFALAEAFARGFDTFSLKVKQGDFDRVLLRPLNPFFQIAVQDVQMMRVGRFLQGFCVLIFSSKRLSLSLFSFQTLIILVSILATASLFYGLFVIQATISFWTIETLEIMNVTTYGGLQAGQYPLHIYNRSFRLIFTLLIPLACVAFYPLSALLKLEDSPYTICFVAPVAGFLFFYLSYRIWCLGVRHYCSSGS